MNVEITAKTLADITEKSMIAIGNNDYNLSETDENESLEINCSIITNICTYKKIINGVEYNGSITLPEITEDTNLGSDFGTLNATFHGTVPYTLDNNDTSSIGAFDFNITITRTEDGADINLTNISLEDNETSANISDLSVRTIYTYDTENNTIDLTDVKLNTVTLTGICSDYTITGKLTLSNYISIEDSNSIPTRLIFNGSLSNINTNIKIEGKIEITLSFIPILFNGIQPIINVTVDAVLTMPESPKIDLRLTYTNNELNEETYHNYTIDYKYDDTYISIEGSLDKIGENGHITISDNNGIEVLIIIENGDIVEGDDESETGSIITHNGVLIGTIEYRDALLVIVYADGSFESLP